MAWLLVPYLGINALLFNSYLETDGNIGGDSLVIFNATIAFIAVAIYLIFRFTSDR